MTKAFTLTELLISMGVVGTLVAITLPALSASRERSRNGKCLSNLKQIATTEAVYRSNPKFMSDFPGWRESYQRYDSQGNLTLNDFDICPSKPRDIDEEQRHSYFYPVVTFVGGFRTINDKCVEDLYDITKIRIVEDNFAWHGSGSLDYGNHELYTTNRWKNAGYLDGHANIRK